jgi:hypothetical protein
MGRIAVLAAAAALGAGVLGCGDSDSSDKGSTDAVALPTVTAPTVTQAPSTTTTTPTDVKQEDVPPAGADRAQRVACPPSLGRRQCRELADAVEGGRGGSPLDRCPAGMSPETCQVLEQIAHTKPGTSHRLPGCEGLSQEECAAALEQFAGG